ncbi:hypothetical protein [Coleofasciculus sp. G2-EDA-02]
MEKSHCTQRYWDGSKFRHHEAIARFIYRVGRDLASSSDVALAKARSHST